MASDMSNSKTLIRATNVDGRKVEVTDVFVWSIGHLHVPLVSVLYNDHRPRHLGDDGDVDYCTFLLNRQPLCKDVIDNARK